MDLDCGNCKAELTRQQVYCHNCGRMFCPRCASTYVGKGYYQNYRCRLCGQEWRKKTFICAADRPWWKRLLRIRA
jgi:hypothetical protein